MSRGKSVVVNYNDKAFLFNVSTGETVDRMQARLAEAYNIPIDQQQLFVANPKGSKEDSDLPVSASEPRVDFFADFNVTNFPFLPQIYNTVDYFILDLRPTLSALLNRKVVLEYVKKTLSKCLGARAFCVGSSMNNVFLPDEMMEVTPFLCKGQEDKWVLRVNEGLCAAAFASMESRKGNAPAASEDSSDEDISVNTVTFDCNSTCVLADINKLKVRISQNQLEALYNGALLEDINFICKKSSLFKKSLLLIKSWCSYDSKQFSPNGKTVFPDVLPPFVLDIMVVHIISRYGDAIEHPVHTLGLFLHFFAFIDFSAVVITMTDLLMISNMEPLVDSELEVIKERKLANEINLKYRVLFNGYRHRYEATVTANKRAKEESAPIPESVPPNNDGAIIEEAVEKNKNPGISWGISSENPSLTVDYKPPSTSNANSPPFTANNKNNVKDDKHLEQFTRSFMNVIGPFKPECNIAGHLTAADMQELSSLLQCGLKRFEQTLHVCRSAAASNPRNCVDVGDGVEIPIESYFIGECFGLSRDKIVVEKKKHGEVNVSDADAIEELRMSKYYCEVETPEDVLRHAELIMGSKITADAVANLIVHIIEQMGPLPIGEIGKLLQEFTGNQNLSRILKSQFRGLKKLIEGYPSSLMVGGDHNFNPHVYLARPKDPPAPDAWVDEKKVSAPEFNHHGNLTVAPPKLQVQHEKQQQQQQPSWQQTPQMYQQHQQQQHQHQQLSPPSLHQGQHNPFFPTRARDGRDAGMKGRFQLSSSSPPYVSQSQSSNIPDSWRDAPPPHHSMQPRENRLPSSYYLDDRVEATETAFRSERFRDPYQQSSSMRGSGPPDVEDRSSYAPRGMNYYRPEPDMARSKPVQYQDASPQDRGHMSSMMGMPHNNNSLHVSIDEDYASSHLDASIMSGGRFVPKVTPADYINSLSAPPGLGHYSRDVQSSHDKSNSVRSIFGNDMGKSSGNHFDRQPGPYYPGNHGNSSRQHEQRQTPDDRVPPRSAYYYTPNSSREQHVNYQQVISKSDDIGSNDQPLIDSNMLPYFLREN